MSERESDGNGADSHWLVSRHISARKGRPGTLRWAGQFVEVHTSGGPRRGGGSRGRVRGFSAASKRRLMRAAAAIEWGKLPGWAAFVTLTYPGEAGAQFIARDGQQARRDLRRFKERLRRHLAKLEAPLRALWKLEFQRRGVVHWHLLVVVPETEGVKAFRRWVRDAWWEAVGSGDGVARFVGTTVKPWQGERRLIGLYFAKYGAKLGAKAYQDVRPHDGAWGRSWGLWGIEPEWQVVPLSGQACVELWRILRAYHRSRGRRRARRYRSAACRGDLAARLGRLSATWWQDYRRGQGL